MSASSARISEQTGVPLDAKEVPTVLRVVDGWRPTMPFGPTAIILVGRVGLEPTTKGL